MTMLRITFLGTSASVPTKKRGLSSIAILRGSELLLFDCGEGVQRVLMASGLGLNRRMKVFITHLHGDHCLGVLGLIQTQSMLNREKLLSIYGPPKTKGFVEANRRYLNFGLTFPLKIIAVREGIIFDDRESGYFVEACKGEHTILSYGYKLTEYPRVGVFHPEKAIELGVPEGALWSELQKGRSVVVDGRTVSPREVLGPQRKGRMIGISGDTRPTKALGKFFKGANILIFDSTYGEDRSEKARENMHSTAREAAELAMKAGVGTLVLTHFSPRYEDVSELVKEASSIHPNVIEATDLQSLVVPYPD